jgi:hypothetical protein
MLVCNVGTEYRAAEEGRITCDELEHYYHLLSVLRLPATRLTSSTPWILSLIRPHLQQSQSSSEMAS